MTEFQVKVDTKENRVKAVRALAGGRQATGPHLAPEDILASRPMD